MYMDEELSLEQRVERLESLVSELRGNSASSGPAPRSPTQRAARPTRERVPNPLASRSLEWWLARSGAVLTSLALILLYQYAIERNWITPLIRVLAGIAVGAALIFSAARFTSQPKPPAGLPSAKGDAHKKKGPYGPFFLRVIRLRVQRPSG